MKGLPLERKTPVGTNTPGDRPGRRGQICHHTAHHLPTRGSHLQDAEPVERGVHNCVLAVQSAQDGCPLDGRVCLPSPPHQGDIEFGACAQQCSPPL